MWDSYKYRIIACSLLHFFFLFLIGILLQFHLCPYLKGTKKFDTHTRNYRSVHNGNWIDSFIIITISTGKVKEHVCAYFKAVNFCFNYVVLPHSKLICYSEKKFGLPVDFHICLYFHNFGFYKPVHIHLTTEKSMHRNLLNLNDWFIITYIVNQLLVGTYHNSSIQGLRGKFNGWFKIRYPSEDQFISCTSF